MRIKKPRKGNTRVLVIRPDRMGDVILSTPVLEAIKSAVTDAFVSFAVRAEHTPILKGLNTLDDVFVLDPKGRHKGFRGFLRLVNELRAQNFHVSVLLNPELKIAAACFVAGIRYRVGPLHKWYTFLFLNRGQRQRRSLVEMHEADYNLMLLRKIGIRTISRQFLPKVYVHEKRMDEASDYIDAHFQMGSEKEKIVAVHPGMGGSALNWPEEHYIDLIRKLLVSKRLVLVTGGTLEDKLLSRISTEFKPFVDSKRLAFYGGKDAKDISFLAGLFHKCDVIVAPSTGPLHLASALGKKTVSFYPPIRVQSAMRWGPYTEDFPRLNKQDRAEVLVPEVYCGQDFKCIGSQCIYFSCMHSMDPEFVLMKIETALMDDPFVRSGSTREEDVNSNVKNISKEKTGTGG